MPGQPQETIDTFPNRSPDRDYLIQFSCPEFTCVCPMTGQPDFATININYVPGETCVELKSLKFYLWSFRNKGIFHENVVNEIADHLKSQLNPRYLHVEGDFMIRGGIHTKVDVSFGTFNGKETLNPS